MQWWMMWADWSLFHLKVLCVSLPGILGVNDRHPLLYIPIVLDPLSVQDTAVCLFSEGGSYCGVGSVRKMKGCNKYQDIQHPPY